MRITYRVAVVGGIPITLAAAIAVVAWFMLEQAERARDGAVLAGTAYRNLMAAIAARNEFVTTTESDRPQRAAAFATLAGQARENLDGLAEIAQGDGQRAATEAAHRALSRYIERMDGFVAVTTENDKLIAGMEEQARKLIQLTDDARERQHASNMDLVATLTARDARLRLTRDIVDGGYELGAAVAAVRRLALESRLAPAGAGDGQAGQALRFEIAGARHAAERLAASLDRAGRAEAAAETRRLVADYLADVEASLATDRTVADGGPPVPGSASRLAAFTDRLLKIGSTDHRAIHDEVAELLTYSIRANETEQATQNVAITVLKLSGRTADAVYRRDPVATAAILDDSRGLSATVSGLPISPLIQGEMIEMIDLWRSSLARITEGLLRQNEMIADMDDDAVTMIDGARTLDEIFSADAESIGDSLKTILVLGATIGLMLGSGAAYVVARSITRPLHRLQRETLQLAEDPRAGGVSDAERRDELGDLARTVNFFVTEIGQREADLRQAKDRADQALADLKRAQAELIQAEKLASLGQLVAGVAHEINTPLGIALTGATFLGDEVENMKRQVEAGRVSKGDFTRFVERAVETSRLLFNNLTRAADLVQSFKQVAADQASGERRVFALDTWLHDMVLSLGPALKRAGHRMRVSCPEGLKVDGFPGALAQVLTNLVMNSLVHAYEPGQAGELSVDVDEPEPGMVRLVYADDGKGIPPENRPKVFDPFFTTGRGSGSTGLGLHIVYNLVTGKLQGRIELVSERGRGTRFVIHFPRIAAEAPARPVADAAHP